MLQIITFSKREEELVLIGSIFGFLIPAILSPIGIGLLYGAIGSFVGSFTVVIFIIWFKGLLYLYNKLKLYNELRQPKVLIDRDTGLYLKYESENIDNKLILELKPVELEKEKKV
jgi:hypothetical protein